MYVDSGQRDSRALAFRRAACALKSYPKYATLLFILLSFYSSNAAVSKTKGEPQVVGQKQASLILQILCHLRNKVKVIYS